MADYNGVTLPDLPTDYDTSEYPYIYINKHDNNSWYGLYVCDKPAYAEWTNEELGYAYIYSASDCKAQYYRYYIYGENSFVYQGDQTGKFVIRAVEVTGEHLIWTNTDICFEDGTVYIESSVTPTTEPSITSLTLNETAVSLARGESFQFEATVEGEGDFDPSVHFILYGYSFGGGTTPNDGSGLITIGEGESNTTLRLFCESVQAPSFYATAIITVTDPVEGDDTSGDSSSETGTAADFKAAFWSGFAAGAAMYGRGE